MKTIVLVVLYGRENTKNSTTQSLLNLDTNYKDYTLLLFNNGPSRINTEGDIHFLDLQKDLILFFYTMIFQTDR